MSGGIDNRTFDTGTIGVGIIGLGFMGRTHLGAHDAARRAGWPVRVVAVADRSAERLAGDLTPAGNIAAAEAPATAAANFDPDSLRRYADPEALLADRDVQLVSICTHTETHVELALRAIAAGKHVLIEKPLALSAAECERVVVVARGAKTRVMPALCVRFWPGWAWVRERIASGEFGRVRSAVFQRLGSPPTWATDFYADPGRSGGGIVDLHIHDADFVQFCFGKPDEVVSTGSINHLTTLYRYRGGPAHVVAEGGWGHTPGFPFRMRFIVAFERATAEFDSSRKEPLTLTLNGQTTAVPVEALTGWDVEIRHLLDAIANPGMQLIAPIEAARDVAVLLEAERRAVETGTAQRL